MNYDAVLLEDVVDIVEWVCIKYQEIGDLPFFHCSNVLREFQEARRIYSSGLENS